MTDNSDLSPWAISDVEIENLNLALDQRPVTVEVVFARSSLDVAQRFIKEARAEKDAAKEIAHRIVLGRSLARLGMTPVRKPLTPAASND